MKEIITFFQQYESIIYGLLLTSIVVYGFRFYKAWEELRGSVFGLEQVNAQRRLNRSAVAIFTMIIIGVAVFSLVTFAFPIFVDMDEAVFGDVSGETAALTPNPEGTPMAVSENDSLATATPLPTVEVNPEYCEEGKIEITFPEANQEVSGVIEVTGIVNVEDFSYYVFEIARAEEELWLPITASRTLVPEDSVLSEWDTSFYPPGSYVIQLEVNKSDNTAYAPCRIPIQIGAK